MRLITVLIGATLGIGLLPSSSNADIIFTLGNNPQPGDENVQFNSGATGTTILGETNQSQIPVQFTSTQTLTAPTNNRIEATDGTSQIGLTNVTITSPGHTYGDLIFNPAITGQIGEPGGILTVSVTDNFGNVATINYTLNNGQNFLTITTAGGESIVSTNLSYSLPGGFSNLSQIRISELLAVPEPSSFAIFGTSLGAVATCLALRRSVRSRPYQRSASAPTS